MSKPNPPEESDDNPEWTEEDFARARPGAEVLPSEFVEAIRRAVRLPTRDDER